MGPWLLLERLLASASNLLYFRFGRQSLSAVVIFWALFDHWLKDPSFLAHYWYNFTKKWGFSLKDRPYCSDSIVTAIRQDGAQKSQNLRIKMYVKSRPPCAHQGGVLGWYIFYATFSENF